jgi:hypothetical protein
MLPGLTLAAVSFAHFLTGFGAAHSIERRADDAASKTSTFTAGKETDHLWML